MRLSFLLPGMSAASRLGISETDHDAGRLSSTRRLSNERPRIDEDADRLRLPKRDESFYWALAHSHL